MPRHEPATHRGHRDPSDTPHRHTSPATISGNDQRQRSAATISGNDDRPQLRRAAQLLACLMSWPELDRPIVNPNGGAVAPRHPIGCSGARILTSLVHEPSRRGGHGPATMCVGRGIAMVVPAG
ncbi:MAG TPA: hypothetical protein VIS05_09900 [Ilumatobacter sp.]